MFKIVAAFRGMHVSPAKYSFGKCDRKVTDGQTEGRTDRQTDGQTTDKVIPMCRYASQATQKVGQRSWSRSHVKTLCYHWKGLVIRNTFAKYESLIS